jgi:hypothetical protein
MKSIQRTLFFIGLTMLSVTFLLAADNPKDTARNSNKQNDKTDNQVPYLGVHVTSIHPALAHHLRESLSRNQGLLVQQVDENAAAAKAGIKEHDILTTYDDQKLLSTEQLGKLVHADRVGREVTIGYLRDGKPMKAQVKLGEYTEGSQQSWMPFNRRGFRRFMEPGQQSPFAQNGRSQEEGWETFDSMTLKKLSDNKFRAEVQYLDKGGKTRKHTFERTRDEIDKAIQNEKDMKPMERAHLERALGLGNNEDDWEMLPWFGPSPSSFQEPF